MEQLLRIFNGKSGKDPAPLIQLLEEIKASLPDSIRNTQIKNKIVTVLKEYKV